MAVRQCPLRRTVSNPEKSRRPLVIEVLLDGEVIATGTLSSEIRDLSRSVGMPLVPAMLRRIADKWEATDRLENDRRKS